jgi:hypothetical protein
MISNNRSKKIKEQYQKISSPPSTGNLHTFLWVVAMLTIGFLAYTYFTKHTEPVDKQQQFGFKFY